MTLRLRLLAGLLIALMAAGLTACADDDADDRVDVRSVGGPGSGCALPVSFDMPEDWGIEAIDPRTSLDGLTGSEREAWATIAAPGRFKLVCELDAKPAGNLGMIRVYTGPAGVTEQRGRALVRDFVDAYDGDDGVTFQPLGAAGVTGTGFSWDHDNEVLEETLTKHGFLVTGPGAATLVMLGGFDQEEIDEMLPTYDVARESVARR